MLDNIPDEYEIDPGTDIDHLAELVVEQYSDAIIHDIEEAIFADEGPIEYLAWIALEGYTRHEFFYYDDDPETETLRRLMSWSPDADEMQLLKAYLLEEFDIVETIPHAALLEIPDPYLPGKKPRANIAFYTRSDHGEVNIGLNATPPEHEGEIIDHIDRLVPASDLETFARNIVYTFYDELKTTAEDHLIEGEIAEYLNADPDFRHQTTKPLPARVYPPYTGEEMELWQKPISKEPAIEASQGFVQIWLPDADEQIGFVTLTSGEYAEKEALAAVQQNLQSKLD